jgi:hypothetical protein
MKPAGTLSASLLGVALWCATLAAAAPPEIGDGAHDFDFNFGVWRTQIRRVVDPFTAHSNSVELTGTVTVRKLWDGRGQYEEIEADGPNGHWQGMTVFLYNPSAHQWSQTFADSKEGELTTPLIGGFHDGVGELYAQETFKGRTVLIRGTWSDIKPDSHHFEEAFSADGGRTWHPAFIASLTRLQR